MKDHLFYGFLTLVALYAALALTGCGKIKIDHEASGKVEHEVTVNLDNIRGYFLLSCAEKADGDQCFYAGDTSKCADCMMADFLDKTGTPL